MTERPTIIGRALDPKHPRPGSNFIKNLVTIACAGCLCALPLLSAAAQASASSPPRNLPLDGTHELLPPTLAGPARWSAHWIIAPDAITGVNLMFLARRAFDLSHVPERAVIYITADTRYQLFVNGSFVRRGPARSAAHHQSYDAFDVAGFLRPGRNVLAVRFHHTGLAEPPYHDVTRPGVLVQLEMFRAGVVSTVGTDTQWKIMRDPSWDSGSPAIVPRFHDAFVDLVDLRKRPGDWTSPTFDDSAWSAAVSITPGRVTPSAHDERIPGFQWWPKPKLDIEPQAITPPWVSLVPRDLPVLTESAVRAARLVFCGKIADPADAPSRAATSEAYRFAAMPLLKLPPIDESRSDRSGLEGVEAYARGQSPLVVRGGGSGQSTFLVFDLGEVHSGHSRLDIEGSAGTVVDVLCTPYLLNRIFNPNILNSINADRIVLSGRREQWEAFFFKPARYLAVVVRGAAEPVRIHFAGVTRIAYPWTRRGQFVTPENPWLERFWQAGAKTIEVITTDAYTDNYRERRQYPQTSYYAAQGNYAAFGDTFLQRRYLLQNAEEQGPNGALPTYAPMTIAGFKPFFDAQFFWLMGWRDYLLYSGDAATARRLLSTAQRVMQRLAELAGPDGLIADPPYNYWIDWADLDRRGANFVINALYLLTLEDYAQALDWLGERGGDECRRKADGLRGVLREKFWNPPRGLFAEALVAGRQSPRFSEHAIGIALAARIASPEQVQAILLKLQKPDSDLVPVSPLFVYWTFRGLCVSGHVDEALSMLESRFAHQLQGGNGTLWEEWNLDLTYRNGIPEKTTRADAQGECGIFPMALTRYVGGLEPVAPGMREVLVRRVPSSLKNIQAVLPSPLGDLRVAWSTSDRGGELLAEVPRGMVAKLDLASVDVPAGRELLLGGKPIAASELSGRWYAIPEGAHRLTFRTR